MAGANLASVAIFQPTMPLPEDWSGVFIRCRAIRRNHLSHRRLKMLLRHGKENGGNMAAEAQSGIPLLTILNSIFSMPAPVTVRHGIEISAARAVEIIFIYRRFSLYVRTQGNWSGIIKRHLVIVGISPQRSTWFWRTSRSVRGSGKS